MSRDPAGGIERDIAPKSFKSIDLALKRTKKMYSIERSLCSVPSAQPLRTHYFTFNEAFMDWTRLIERTKTCAARQLCQLKEGHTVLEEVILPDHILSNCARASSAPMERSQSEDLELLMPIVSRGDRASRPRREASPTPSPPESEVAERGRSTNSPFQRLSPARAIRAQSPTQIR